MPHHYTRTDQVKFLTEWFDSWSDLQREDFMPIMIQALNPADHVNGLVGGVTTLRVGERRPSLFDCQVKLFQDWYENWTPSEKERLLEHFMVSDPEFASRLNKDLHSRQTEGEEEEEDTSQISNDAVESPSPLPVVTDDNKDDGVSPGSHSSSPLSSLSQPLSPHDSGLEENHSDLETTPPRSTNVDSSVEGARDSVNTTPSNSSSGKEVVVVELVDAAPAPAPAAAAAAVAKQSEISSSEDPSSSSSVTTDIQESI